MLALAQMHWPGRHSAGTRAALALALGWALHCPAAYAQVDLPPAVGPTSVASMQFGADRDTELTALRIGKQVGENAEVAFSVALDPTATSSTVDVRAIAQTVYCRTTDIEKADEGGGKAGCRNSRRYRYDPLVSARVILAEGPEDTTGAVLAEWSGSTCRDPVHHCSTVVAHDSLVVEGAARYVNLVVSASHRSASSGQLLAFDSTQGQMQVIQVIPALGAAPLLDPKTVGPALGSFDMSRGGSTSDDDDLRAFVIFTSPITVAAGDVVVARTQFDARVKRTKDNAPLLATYVYVALLPTDVENPDWDSGLVVSTRTGENCSKRCSLTRVGAARIPEAGDYNVNVMAFAKDHEGRTRGTVVYDGTLAVTHMHGEPPPPPPEEDPPEEDPPPGSALVRRRGRPAAAPRASRGRPARSRGWWPG